MVNPNQPNQTILDGIVDASMVPGPTLYSEMNSTIKGWVEDFDNPQYNLPTKVLFPAVAGDVVAAIKFAKEHNLELSVKNSGHSYTSASSKGDTLLINMKRYYQYATNDGIVDCDSDASDYSVTDSDDALANQPCRLSLAKNKDAVLRVGMYIYIYSDELVPNGCAIF